MNDAAPTADAAPPSPARVLAQAFAGTGLTAHEFGALEILTREESRGLTMSQLAARMEMTSGGLTTCVDRLEARGLLRRANSRTDRRVIYAVLTRDGFEAGRRFHAQHRRDIVAKLEAAVCHDDPHPTSWLCDLLAPVEADQRP